MTGWVGRIALTLVGLGLLAMSGLFLVIGGAATASGVLHARDRNELLWAVPTTFLSAFCVAWSVRLVLGRPRRDGGLLSPRWFIAVGIFFVAAPAVHLVTGSYRRVGVSTWAIIALLVLSLPVLHGYRLLAEERRRRSTEDSVDANEDT